MSKKIHVETITEPYNGILLDPKSNFYFINALGEVVWLKCRSRKKAQDYLNQEYGDNFFHVRALKN